MDGPSRDIDHLKRFIEYLFWFWTRILDSLFLDFEYLSLLFISTIFVHCGEKPRIPFKMGKLTLLIKFSHKLCTLISFFGHHFAVL